MLLRWRDHRPDLDEVPKPAQIYVGILEGDLAPCPHH